MATSNITLNTLVQGSTSTSTNAGFNNIGVALSTVATQLPGDLANAGRNVTTGSLAANNEISKVLKAQIQKQLGKNFTNNLNALNAQSSVNRLVTSIQGNMTTALMDSLLGSNLGLSKDKLNSIVSNTILKTPELMVSMVTQTVQNQLVSIPKGLTGGVNPVDLTTGKIGPQALARTLQNTVGTLLSPSITSRLIGKLKSELASSLDPAILNNLNLDLFTNGISSIVNEVVESNVQDTLTEYTDILFSTNTGEAPQTLPTAYETLLSNSDVDKALEDTQDAYMKALSNLYLDEAEKFDPFSSDNLEKLVVLQKGFMDPSANYPTGDYDGFTDVNKLASGVVKGTIVEKKNTSRMIGAKLPGGESWDQPPVPYRGEYPYNKVTQTESGHVVEHDDTPGAERLHTYHKSGTFEEIDNTGSRVRRTVGSSYEIIERNGKIYIAGRADVSISGNCNIYVGNDANIEVDGDTHLKCHNNITAEAGGKMFLTAVEEINLTSKKIFMEAYENMNIKSKIDMNLLVDETMNIKSKQAMNVFSQDTMDIKSQGYTKIYAPSLYTYSNNFYNQTTGSVHFKGGSTFNADYNQIFLNSNKAVESSQAGDTIDALKSNIGILSGRKPVIHVIKDDPSPTTQADKISLLLDEPAPSGSKEEKDVQDRAVLSGQCTREEIEAGPVEGKSEEITSQQTRVLAGQESLKSVTSLPGNYKLSENFTLEMLSSKAAVSSYDIVPNPAKNLTYGDIVYNLHLLAINVLEPVKKMYPNMFVTSAFRSPAASCNAPLSQHPLGMAADIQFRGVPQNQYYEIALGLAKVLNYDQFLLEYCGYAKNPWIHISFAGDKNRKQVMTFWNHKTYSQKLTNLENSSGRPV